MCLLGGSEWRICGPKSWVMLAWLGRHVLAVPERGSGACSCLAGLDGTRVGCPRAFNPSRPLTTSGWCGGGSGAAWVLVSTFLASTPSSACSVTGAQPPPPALKVPTSNPAFARAKKDLRHNDRHHEREEILL